jgi:hypothetical protein
MHLCATIAHPREWPLQEYGLRTLALFLLVRDPRELHRQIVPIGEGFGVEPLGRAVFLTSSPPGGGGKPAAGMLHLFANDWWQAVDNNTGAITLRISRVMAAPAGRPIFELSWPRDAARVFDGSARHWARAGSLAP